MGDAETILVIVLGGSALAWYLDKNVKPTGAPPPPPGNPPPGTTPCPNFGALVAEGFIPLSRSAYPNNYSFASCQGFTNFSEFRGGYPPGGKWFYID